MHTKFLFAIPLALALCAVSGSVRAQAANPQSTDGDDSPAASSAAVQMVPAQALLSQDLDTKKMQPGQQFKAVLSETAHLRNGVELPKGTALMGTVATTETAAQGAKPQLTLRFTQADLKDGKTIPIEATIVGVAPPQDNEGMSTSDEEAPDTWDGRTLRFDMIGVLSGIDLHSRIAG